MLLEHLIDSIVVLAKDPRSREKQDQALGSFMAVTVLTAVVLLLFGLVGLAF